MRETPTSWDSIRIGDVVRIIKPGHEFNGRTGQVVMPFQHPNTIKLEPDQFWVEMISDEGDPFRGRYYRSELELAYK